MSQSTYITHISYLPSYMQSPQYSSCSTSCRTRNTCIYLFKCGTPHRHILLYKLYYPHLHMYGRAYNTRSTHLKNIIENVEIELTDEQLATVTGGTSSHQQNDAQRRHDEDERRRGHHWHPGHWGWDRQHHRDWTPGGWW